MSQIEVWNRFISEGNMEALAQVYFHCYDLLYDYGQKFTSDKQLVEDSIQEVFINIIKQRKNIGTVKSLDAYLISTFRRQLFIDFKKQKKTVLTEQLPEERFDYYNSPEQNVSDNENLDRLHIAVKQCVDKLTQKQQEILYLRFEREISYEEIAATLNITVESCYKSTYRSIRIIRSEIGKIQGKKENVFPRFV